MVLFLVGITHAGMVIQQFSSGAEPPAHLFYWDGESTSADVTAGTTTGIIEGNGTFTTGNGGYGGSGEAYDNVDDGSSDIYFPIADITGFDISDFTLTLYFNVQTLADYEYMFGIGADTSNYYQAHVYANGRVYCRSEVAGTEYFGYIAGSGNEITASTWHKLEVVVNESTDTFTMTLDDTYTYTAPTFTESFSGTPTYIYFGARYQGSDELDTLIDEVTID